MTPAVGKDTMDPNPSTTATTTTITVAYAGGDERRGPLTMGQANMIRCILRDDPTHINIHDVWPVPEGTTSAAVTDALRALAVRHEGLRTTFPHPPGAAPVDQVVAAEGTFTVTVLDHAEPPGDPAGYAESVARAARAPMRRTTTTPSRSWPGGRARRCRPGCSPSPTGRRPSSTSPCGPPPRSSPPRRRRGFSPGWSCSWRRPPPGTFRWRRWPR